MGRLRRVSRRILVVLVCIVAAYFIVRGVLFAIYAPKVKKEIALLKAEGGATRFSDLVPKDIPDEENAARFLKEHYA